MANIYVRKSGSDSNDGSTPALAKLTIASAISAATSGDSIYIGSGVYKEGNLSTGKKINIIGDTTGEYTGDAGEVIWSGMNNDDTDFASYTKAIEAQGNYLDLTIKNILFENWKIVDSGNLHMPSLIYINSSGASLFKLENIKIHNVFLKNTYSAGGVEYNSLITIINPYSGENSCILKDILIDGINIESAYSDDTVYIIKIKGTGGPTIENIEIKNIISNQSIYVLSSSNFDLGGRTGYLKYKNISINNIFSKKNICGIYFYYNDNYSSYFRFYNNEVKNLYSDTSATGMSLSGGSRLYNKNLENCSVFNLIAPSVKKYNTTFTNNNSIDKCYYKNIYPYINSKYSPLRGQGYTEFPTTDIEGNPRPAYGNGTKCDIGASEATSEVVQQESIIKDSGDYSAKVAPCNYFKKVFQVPVTASELRTVKVKIRIDGTWGTYLPRVSLSGQGMTLSTATKNSTTGSFEELTVSGTPTTTGIALLTIEAHSPNTDAAFYIDTITIE